MNDEANKLAKACLQGVSDTNTEQNNFSDKAPVLTNKGFLTSLGITDALCTAYSEMLYEKYNKKS